MIWHYIYSLIIKRIQNNIKLILFSSNTTNGCHAKYFFLKHRYVIIWHQVLIWTYKIHHRIHEQWFVVFYGYICMFSSPKSKHSTFAHLYSCIWFLSLYIFMYFLKYAILRGVLIIQKHGFNCYLNVVLCGVLKPISNKFL